MSEQKYKQFGEEFLEIVKSAMLSAEQAETASVADSAKSKSAGYILINLRNKPLEKFLAGIPTTARTAITAVAAGTTTPTTARWTTRTGTTPITPTTTLASALSALPLAPQ